MDEPLTKHERKLLHKQAKQAEREKLESQGKLNKTIFTAILIGVIAWFGWGIIKALTVPIPGEKFADQGRDHVTDISQMQYNSIPPTSGSHFAIWAKPGVYDRIISDGHLIHSLEHGYVNLAYNCNYKLTSTSPFTVYAHEEGESELVVPVATDSGKPALTQLTYTPEGQMSSFTPANPPPVEITLPDSFNTQECKDLVAKLTEYTQKYDRIIISPRIDIPHPIVATAWNYRLELDTFDQASLDAFIKSRHNMGPEKTVE